MDFIGKVENMQNDFETICKKVGIPIVNLSTANVTAKPKDKDLLTENARLK